MPAGMMSSDTTPPAANFSPVHSLMLAAEVSLRLTKAGCSRCCFPSATVSTSIFFSWSKLRCIWRSFRQQWEGEQWWMDGRSRRNVCEQLKSSLSLHSKVPCASRACVWTNRWILFISHCYTNTRRNIIVTDCAPPSFARIPCSYLSVSFGFVHFILPMGWVDNGLGYDIFLHEVQIGWRLSDLKSAFGAALSLDISLTTAAPSSMKDPAVALEGSATTSGFPPTSCIVWASSANISKPEPLWKFTQQCAQGMQAIFLPETESHSKAPSWSLKT